MIVAYTSMRTSVRRARPVPCRREQEFHSKNWVEADILQLVTATLMRQLGYVRYRACPSRRSPTQTLTQPSAPVMQCAKPGHFSLGRGENSLDDGIGQDCGELGLGITVGKEKREMLREAVGQAVLAEPWKYMNSIVSKLIKREDGAIGSLMGSGLVLHRVRRQMHNE